MVEICNRTLCTGCGACEQACPKHCIKLTRDDFDTLYPVINQDDCIDCGLCKKKCPSCNHIVTNKPYLCYAAWSNNAKVRHNAASGGMASELYQLALERGWFSAGVAFDEQACLKFIPIQNENDIEKVRNSKYVFAQHDGIYDRFKNELKKGKECLFIGLPCQVAALKSYLGADDEKLHTCDIICHGVSPIQYLYSHISNIEKKYNFKHTTFSFREPSKGTQSFYFSLWKGKKMMYARNSHTNDVFELAYHYALIYRENCYHCRYAKTERVGDITIGDFDGLGNKQKFNYYRYQLSCVMVNNEKGESLITGLKDKMTFVERQVEEAIEGQRQLRQPALPHKNRNVFLLRYKELHDFETCAKEALRKEMVRNIYMNFFVRKPIRLLQIVTPQWFRNYIKMLIRYARKIV